MSHTSFKRMSVGLFVALMLMTVPAYAVKTFKISNYGGGHQIWFEAEDFDQRDPDSDQYYPVVDHVGAFGKAVSRAGGAGGMIRWTFNISKAGGKGGTWYFWGRVIDPGNQSDFMLVDGTPGDPVLPTAPPYPGTSSAPGFTNEMRIFEEDVANWGWARSNHAEAHTKQLRDGENTMRIVHRQGDSTVFWDVFVWTDSTSYVPTDADYQNATPAPLETIATNPDPKNGAVIEAMWASLSWAPADRAVSHNVYLGDKFEDVNIGAANTLQGNVTVPVFVVGLGMPGDPYPAGLVPGTTYYWRIDEVNQADPNSPWKGDIWSFSIPPKKAYNPSPVDGARYIDPAAATLSWVAGLGTKLHYVYFGDNFDTVNNASKGVPQPTTTYTPAGPLAKGKTYYWRVDEFEGAATNRGDVWSFTTLPDIAVTDPNLSGWWKLDEGQGKVAVDWSGHNNHGKIEGRAQWTAGYDGGALSLDGSGARVIDDDGESYLNGLRALTIALWIKSNLIGTDRGFIEGEVPSSGNDSFCSIRYDAAGSSFGGTNVMKMAVTSNPGGEQQLESSSNVQTTEWQHVAMTWESGGLIRLYINGAEDNPSGRNGPNNAGVSSGCTAFVIGQGSKDTGAAGWNGLVDDVRVYNKALNSDQIKQIMRGDFSRSWNPSPANGSTSDVVHAIPLTWSRGDKASQHDVYFGLDKAAVTNASATDTTGVYRGRQSTTSYTPPEGVQFSSGPYYWRIDEVNTDASITAGTLWTFSVASYILIDDFEAYNDIAAGQPGSNLVYTTWLDGFGTTTNGSTMGYPTGASLETANRHGGAKAAPLIYNNATASFSEVERTLAAQNWTTNGIQTLSLWFCGASTNVPGQLYVKINGVKVLYDGDAANLKKGVWQPWNITLASVGTNLQSVTKLAVGIETKGTTGTLLLDDIRLYPLPRQLVSPVQPDPAGLAARFAFEGNANDSAGGHNGTPNGNPTYAAGKIGQAISLDGLDDYVAVTGVGITGAAPRTIAGWAKMNVTTGIPDWTNVFGFSGAGTNNLHFDIEIVGSGTTTAGYYGIHVYGWEQNIMPPDLEWHHFAATYDGTRISWYGDGLLIGSAAHPGLNTQGDVRIGKRIDTGGFFPGLVDEVQIYSRVLSEAEVAGLAGMTKPYDKPL